MEADLLYSTKTELEKGALGVPPAEEYSIHDSIECEEMLKQWIKEQLEKILILV
jgi:hypothetical protein